jgi:thiamine biosynthesis lipoprotein
MGTLISISLPKPHENKIQKSFELIHEIEMALSSYAPQADIYRLNHTKQLKVSPYTLEALELSRRYHSQSDGYFDITIGSITKEAFRFGEDEKVPGQEELDHSVVDITAIEIEGDSVKLKSGISIDLGGMGKGYAVDKVATYLRSKQIDSGVIAASGDIRCLDQCRIEIQHPFEDGVIASLTTKFPNTAISTSGNYRRYVKSRENNHLINPKSKRSQQYFASITLVAQLANSDLDAYATAASVMPSDKALGFLKECHVEYIIITTDKKVFVSEGLKLLTQNLEIPLMM